MGEEAQAAAPPLDSARINHGKEEEEFSSFNESASFNFPALLNWATAVLAIAGTVFFFLLSKDLANKLTALNKEKQDVITEITSPTFAKVEKEAVAFRSAVTELEKAQKNRYSLNIFLPKFYEHLAKNVEINNLVVSAEGKVSLSGKTKSYRAVADQLLFFRDWQAGGRNLLSGVELLSVSETIKEEKPEVAFSISATLDKTVDLTATDSASAPTESADNAVVDPPAGGTNE